MYSFFPAVVAVLFLGCGIYVLRRASHPRVSLSFFGLCITTFAWQFTWAVLFQVEDPDLGNKLVRLGYFFILFLPTTLYHFLVEITERHAEHSRVYGSYAVAAVLALLLVSSDLVVDGWYDYFFGYYPQAAILHPLHVIQTCIVVLRGLHITWQTQRTAPPRQRIRLRYCVASLLIYLFAAIDYLCNYGVEFYPPGVFLISVSLGLLAVAAVKHQLMDVSVVLSHGVALVMALFSYALLLVSGYVAINLIMPESAQYLVIALGLGFVLLVGEIHIPLVRFLQGFPGRFTRHDEKRLADAIQALSRTVLHHVHLNDMVRDVERVLETHTRLRHFRLFVHSDFSAYGDDTPGLYMLWDVRRGMGDARHTLSAAHPIIRAFHHNPVIHGPELDEALSAVLRRWKATSAIAVRMGDRLMAIALVGLGGNSHHYSSEDLDVIELLPTQLGLGLERVSTYTRMRHSLERTQKSASLLALMNEYQHELKAPLSIMHMYAQTDMPAETLRAEVVVQCERAFELLEKMLNVMRDNRLRSERPVDVNSVARSALRVFPASSMKVRLDLDPRLPPVLGDADDLLILLVNLLKNANEAKAPDRENIVSVRTRWLRERGRVQIIVEDTGTGTTTANLNAGNSSKSGGSGIGLKVTQRIVAEHGGEILFRSTPGQGTRVETCIPAMTSEIKQLECVDD